MPESSGLFFEKDTNPTSKRVLDLFERTRFAYLSALHDPKKYKSKWVEAVERVRDIWDDVGDFSKTIKEVLDEKDLFQDNILNVESTTARNLFQTIKELRYTSDMVNDPFTKKFGDDILDKLMDNSSLLAHFVHWAVRSNKKSLSDEEWAISDTTPDEITGGVAGLDLQSEAIVDYITEHYGDGKDTTRVKSKVKNAMTRLKESFLNSHDEKELDKLLDIEVKKSDEKKKATEDFIVPNKPMYRIFDIDDIKELKGFSGDWLVQEKYDGMRIQIHKIDKKVKIYSYNGKDITDECPDQVKVMEKKHFGECILDAELLLFKKDKPLHRADTIARVFKHQYPDAQLRAHVFDIMRHEDSNLLDEELEERINTLFHQYSMHSEENLAFPSKKDTRIADSIEEINKYAKDIMKIPTAEGVVIKDMTSTYYVGSRKNPKWIKWKKFVDLDLIVLDKKSTKSGMFSYTLGAGPLSMEDARKVNSKKVKDRYYANVGKALNTKEDVEIGVVIRVKVDEVKKKGENYSIYSAKVIEVPEAVSPDKLVTLDLLSQDTKKSLKYDIKALEKGYAVTDYIHGEAEIICKHDDLDGFTIYGFKDNNLMSKNALMDLDLWKEKVKEEFKKGSNTFMVKIRTEILESPNKRMTDDQVVDWVKEHHLDAYKQLFGGKWEKLETRMRGATDLFIRDKAKTHWTANESTKLATVEEEESDNISKALILKNRARMRQMELQDAKERDASITVEATMIGDCCEQLKRGIIELALEDYNEAIEDLGSWDKYVQDMVENYDVKDGDYLPTLEEQMANLEEFIFSDYVDCEWLITEYLDKDYEWNKKLIDEYQACSFGSDYSTKLASIKKESKTPEEYKNGDFKVYMRDDGNLNISFRLKDKKMTWLVDLENRDDIFGLFGKANKFPAQITTNVNVEDKVIDAGKVELGVQRHGYHEYILDGNKFETRLHFRVVPIEKKDTWVCWTGYKQKALPSRKDEGIWDIYQDRYKKLTLPQG
jgi:ATP-dependent DNA ligase